MPEGLKYALLFFGGMFGLFWLISLMEPYSNREEADIYQAAISKCYEQLRVSGYPHIDRDAYRLCRGEAIKVLDIWRAMPEPRPTLAMPQSLVEMVDACQQAHFRGPLCDKALWYDDRR